VTPLDSYEAGCCDQFGFLPLICPTSYLSSEDRDKREREEGGQEGGVAGKEIGGEYVIAQSALGGWKESSCMESAQHSFSHLSISLPSMLPLCRAIRKTLPGGASGLMSTTPPWCTGGEGREMQMKRK
jgi:hypothetical protein